MKSRIFPIGQNYHIMIANGRKDDTLTPVIIHWGKKEKTSLSVEVKTVEGVLIDKKDYMKIELPEGREAISLPGFRPDWKEEGFYIIEYNFK